MIINDINRDEELSPDVPEPNLSNYKGYSPLSQASYR